MSKIEKSFAEKLRIRHAYNKRTGLYKFMGQIVIKLLVIIAIIVGIVLLLNHFFNLSQIIEDYIFSHDTPGVLKEELQRIDKQKNVQRQNRGKLVRVALVGYTNVGKSTLMNLWAKSDVLAENKLFATLDTTVRKVVVKNLPFLLGDTVGFIRKLPKNLLESFKSTVSLPL